MVYLNSGDLAGTRECREFTNSYLEFQGLNYCVEQCKLFRQESNLNPVDVSNWHDYRSWPQVIKERNGRRYTMGKSIRSKVDFQKLKSNMCNQKCILKS